MINCCCSIQKIGPYYSRVLTTLAFCVPNSSEFLFWIYKLRNYSLKIEHKLTTNTLRGGYFYSSCLNSKHGDPYSLFYFCSLHVINFSQGKCGFHFRGMTLTLSYLLQFRICVKDGIKYLQLKSFDIKKKEEEVKRMSVTEVK